MHTPTNKYFKTLFDPIDKTPISWHAHPDNYPTRSGDTPPYIEKQRRDLATEIPYARSVCYDIPDDITKYVETIDWIANTGGILRFEEKQPLDNGKWRVWLVWFDIRGSIPQDVRPG
jgi:hypothetical protein